MPAKSLMKILLLLFLPLFPKAQKQSHNLDSLKLALNSATNDSVKMVALFNLADYYTLNIPDSSKFFADKGIGIAKKIHQPLWVAHFLTENQSYLAMESGNILVSFKLATEALKITKEEKNEKDVYIPKDYEFTSPHQFRLSLLGYTLHQLGNIYGTEGDLKKAISYYHDEIEIFKSLKSKKAMGLVQSSMALGFTYSKLNELDSAILYDNKALEYTRTTGWNDYEGLILSQKGSVFEKRNTLDSARYYYWQSLQVSSKKKNKDAELEANILLALLYQSIRQVDSAKYYATIGMQQSRDLNLANALSVTANIISDAWKIQGNADSALAYLTLSKKVHDSLIMDKMQKLKQFQNINFEEQLRLEKQAQDNVAYKNKIRTVALFVGLGLLSILAFIFYRNNRQKQKANKVLESTLSDLKSTQAQLIQSEKMASLGELTAGIAHEIQNPLNFVNNFSDVNQELLVEMKDEIEKGNSDEAKAIANDVIENEQKINHHGKRADAIVKGMLQHSRKTSGQKERTDINALAEEYLRLSYHGLRAKDKTFNAEMKTDFDGTIGKINVIPQDIGRVLLNLFNNAFYAVNEQKTRNSELYKPTVSVATIKCDDKVQIIVKDNGNGIPQNIVEKIFQPFFTTKPTGEGTGLGLSLAYDIVKAHGGELKVGSKEGEGTEFIIELPN